MCIFYHFGVIVLYLFLEQVQVLGVQGVAVNVWKGYKLLFNKRPSAHILYYRV